MLLCGLLRRSASVRLGDARQEISLALNIAMLTRPPMRRPPHSGVGHNRKSLVVAPKLARKGNVITLAGDSVCLSFALRMSRPEQIAVVIPCLNEGRTIVSLIREIRQFLPNIIVVDDGSTDSTRKEAERARAIVISHETSQGKGASLRAGMELALNHGFVWALTLDGDGQHSPADIPKFLSAAESSTAAMFIGNRMKNAGAMPLLRRIVNRWMSRMIGEFCDVDIPDSQCGFRMVDLNAWKRLPMSSHHFEIESEMIVRFLHAGYSIDFVPVQTRYASETSKIRPLRDSVRWIRWWFSVRNELAVLPHPRYESTPQDATA